MLSSFLLDDMVYVNVIASDWREAIKKGTSILINKSYVEERYQDSIIKIFERFGPYMVIANGVVLAHARPEDGAKKLGLSLITLKYPINFGSELNDPVKLIITLAAPDNNSHIQILKSLMDIFMNEEDLEIIKSSNSKEEVLKIIKKY